MTKAIAKKSQDDFLTRIDAALKRMEVFVERLDEVLERLDEVEAWQADFEEAVKEHAGRPQ